MLSRRGDKPQPTPRLGVKVIGTSPIVASCRGARQEVDRDQIIGLEGQGCITQGHRAQEVMSSSAGPVSPELLQTLRFLSVVITVPVVHGPQHQLYLTLPRLSPLVTSYFFLNCFYSFYPGRDGENLVGFNTTRQGTNRPCRIRGDERKGRHVRKRILSDKLHNDNPSAYHHRRGYSCSTCCRELSQLKVRRLRLRRFLIPWFNPLLHNGTHTRRHTTPKAEPSLTSRAQPPGRKKGDTSFRGNKATRIPRKTRRSAQLDWNQPTRRQKYFGHSLDGAVRPLLFSPV